jgi:hypothetical protein
VTSNFRLERSQCASKFLIEACGPSSPFKRAVDVGPDTNLYPSLLMMPWAEHIVFTEHAPAKAPPESGRRARRMALAALLEPGRGGALLSDDR